MCKKTAIVSILILELFALYNGIDGAILSLGFAIIGGIAGYHLKGIKDKYLG